jgi:hypothetical protein
MHPLDAVLGARVMVVWTGGQGNRQGQFHLPSGRVGSGRVIGFATGSGRKFDALSSMAAIRVVRRTLRPLWHGATLAHDPRRPPTGLFGLEDGLRAPKDLTSQADALRRRMTASVSQLVGDEGSDGMALIDGLDALSDDVCRVMDPAEAVRQLHPDPAYAAAADAALAGCVSEVAALNTDPSLYQVRPRPASVPATAARLTGCSVHRPWQGSVSGPASWRGCRPRHRRLRSRCTATLPVAACTYVSRTRL